MEVGLKSDEGLTPDKVSTSLTDLQALGHKGRGITVAVIDGAVDPTHPLLKHLSINQSAQASGGLHGTAVCSQLAGLGVGIAPDVEIFSLPVFSEKADGTIQGCSEYALAKAMDTAREAGCDLINISGASLSVNGLGSDQLRRAVQACEQAGIAIIAAVGNDGQQSEVLPASLDSVLAVGACDQEGIPASFNNRGCKLRQKMLLASGTNMLVATPESGLAMVNGSSFATPVISGVYALTLNALHQANIAASPEQIFSRLFNTATRFNHHEQPFRRLNIQALVQLLSLELSKKQTFSERNTVMSSEDALALDAPLPAPCDGGSQEAVIPAIESAMVQAAVAEPEQGSVAALELPAISDPAANAPVHVFPETVQPQTANGAREALYRDKVFIIGEIGYDFGTEARLDYFTQVMGGQNAHPFDPVQMAAHLKRDGNASQANALIWTLKIDGIPIYAIEPDSQFAFLEFLRLGEFLFDQEEKGVERVSIAGYITGETRLFNGHTVPKISPVLRGMFNWNVQELSEAVIGSCDKDTDKKEHLSNFLNRVYYELRNRGASSNERAINYAATNAYQMKEIFDDAFKEGLFLNQISADVSPVSRPESDCWDVILEFFNPQERLTAARKLYRYTIDVSDVVPVTVGTLRSWYAY